MNDQSWPADKIFKRAVSKLHPYENNARTHSDAQIDQIVASIKEWGWTIPILIDGDGQIIAGHGRVMAAEKMGLEKVPVMVAKGWSDEQKRAYVLADNQLALNAGWDDKILSAELGDLKNIGVDLSLIGFNADELAKLSVGGAALVDEDETPEIPETPVTKYQDVWLLGDHRLMCGDSIGHADMAKLMGGETAHMVFTDPPYNVDYGSNKNHPSWKIRKIKNDAMSDKDWDLFVEGYLQSILNNCIGNIYICMSDKELGHLQNKFIAMGGKWSSFIIWVKDRFVLSPKDYHSKHETILYGWKNGVSNRLRVEDRTQDDVWEIKRPADSKLHPTMKPVGLVERALKNSSKAEWRVLDLFGGSGSTLIACEKSNRRCYMMELDPKYCDVIINRWQNYTGEVATLDGKAFSDVKIERIGDENAKGTQAKA